MILKIVYAPLCAKYFLNVKEIDFISHLSDKAPSAKVVNGKPVETEQTYSCEEYFEREIGTSIKDDDEYYFSSVRLILKDELEPLNIKYTGNAYLCDDTGKTVDTLR